MKEGVIIASFPAMGKSTFAKKYPNVIDLESTEYQWILSDEQKLLGVEERKGMLRTKNPEWPSNYIAEIKKAVKKYNFVLVTSTKLVRQGLKECGKEYFLIYPEIQDKNEYIKRCIKRGNSKTFINFIYHKYETLINEFDNDEFAHKIQVSDSKLYLEDILLEFKVLTENFTEHSKNTK